jgi:hypothetical protein
MRRIFLVAGAIAALSSVWPATYFAASQPAIYVIPSFGHPGDRIAVSGSGWPPGEIVALYLDSPTVLLGDPGPRADAQGNIYWTLKFPRSTPGVHNLCGDTAYPGSQQPIAAKACVQLELLATAATPSPTSSPAPARGFPFFLAGLGIVIVVAIGSVLLFRRSR